MLSPSWNHLHSIDSSWAHLFVAQDSEVDDLTAKYMASRDGRLIRVIRGTRSMTADRLFQEFAAALQFPYYFGHNWDALRDAFRDLEWKANRGCFLFLTHVDQVLEQQEGAFQVLTELFADTAKEWALPIENDPRGSRPAIPFRIIFHSLPENERYSRSRLERAGVTATLMQGDRDDGAA